MESSKEVRRGHYHHPVSINKDLHAVFLSNKTYKDRTNATAQSASHVNGGEKLHTSSSGGGPANPGKSKANREKGCFLEEEVVSLMSDASLTSNINPNPRKPARPQAISHARPPL